MNHKRKIDRLTLAETKARAEAITAKIDADRADAEQDAREKACKRHGGHMLADISGEGWTRRCIACGRRERFVLVGMRMRFERVPVHAWQ